MKSPTFYFLVLLILHLLPLCYSKPKCIIFNFGDSNSDTGNSEAADGHLVTLPFGQTFFHKPAGRASDGRLYIDFICQSLKMKFLSPYLESTGSDFSNGVNFAVAAAQTGAVHSDQPTCFSLPIQVEQFRHFKDRTLELRRGVKGSKLKEVQFDKAIYSIDIGQNDIVEAFINASYRLEVVLHEKIPNILLRIELAIERLYHLGGWKFLIYGTGPIGCLPTNRISLTNETLHVKQDKIGCVLDYNNASKVFNHGLSELCDRMRGKLNDTTIVYIDMFEIKYDLYANPSTYGFEKPFEACCGEAPYQFSTPKLCGRQGAPVCPHPSRAVIWDGNHYSDAANSVVARKILSGNYSTPSSIKLQHLCKRR